MNKDRAKRYANAIAYGNRLNGGRFTPSPSVEENYEALLYAIYEQAVEDIKHPILCERNRIGEKERVRADAYYFLLKDPYGVMTDEMKGGIKELYERYKRRS